MKSREERIVSNFLITKLHSPKWAFFFQSNEELLIRFYLEKKGKPLLFADWQGNLVKLVDFLLRSFEEKEHEDVYKDWKYILKSKSIAKCKKAIMDICGSDFKFLRKCALCREEITTESHHTCDGCYKFLLKEKKIWKEALENVYSIQ